MDCEDMAEDKRIAGCKTMKHAADMLTVFECMKGHSLFTA